MSKQLTEQQVLQALNIPDFRHLSKKKLTKTNVKELLEGKETLVKGIKTKDRKSYNAVVKIGEKGYIDFIYV